MEFSGDFKAKEKIITEKEKGMNGRCKPHDGFGSVSVWKLK